MKRIIIICLLFSSLSSAGQKIFFDKYKASIVDSSKASFYEILAYDTTTKIFKKKVYRIKGQKFSEFDFKRSPDDKGIAYLWYLGFPIRKFLLHGIYITWHSNGQLASQGNFINGEKDGKSLKWYDNGQLDSEETFIGGKMEGKSISWYENGQMKSEINYSKNLFEGDVITYWPNGRIKRKEQYRKFALLNASCYDSLGNEVKRTGLVTMPSYNGGYTKLRADIARKVVYPLNALQARIQGSVVIEFAVEKNGDITEIEVIEGVLDEMNLEAARAISKLKFKPGTFDGEPVKRYVTFPVNFTL